MHPPDVTWSHIEVLREFFGARAQRLSDSLENAYFPSEIAAAKEIARLRAERAAMIRRVEALPAMALTTAYGAHRISDAVSRTAVLAALREGGDDGR